MGTIDNQITSLGIELPKAATPAANYLPYVKADSLVFISGQITSWNGNLKFVGKLGSDFDIDEGYQAARICALNLISQLQVACEGDLDCVKRVIKLGGFVNSTPEFTDQPQVINGASDLMVKVFGREIGSHARFAVGVSSLPRGVAVEVDGVFQIR